MRSFRHVREKCAMWAALRFIVIIYYSVTIVSALPITKPTNCQWTYFDCSQFMKADAVDFSKNCYTDFSAKPASCRGLCGDHPPPVSRQCGGYCSEYVEECIKDPSKTASGNPTVRANSAKPTSQSTSENNAVSPTDQTADKKELFTTTEGKNITPPSSINTPFATAKINESVVLTVTPPTTDLLGPNPNHTPLISNRNSDTAMPIQKPTTSNTGSERTILNNLMDLSTIISDKSVTTTPKPERTTTEMQLPNSTTRQSENTKRGVTDKSAPNKNAMNYNTTPKIEPLDVRRWIIIAISVIVFIAILMIIIWIAKNNPDFNERAMNTSRQGEVLDL